MLLALIALAACTGGTEEAQPTPTPTVAPGPDGAGDTSSGSAPASAGQPRWTIEDAKQFTEFTLYWLGESYEGLPLTKIIRYRYDPEPPIPPIEAENIVLFIYGSCNPGPDSGCAPPLSIRVEPYCMNPPEGFAPAVRDAPFEVRGALAERIAGHLRIWTGDVGITILTNPVSQVEAAEKLRLVSEGPEGAQRMPGAPNAVC